MELRRAEQNKHSNNDLVQNLAVLGFVHVSNADVIIYVPQGEGKEKYNTRSRKLTWDK